MVGGVSETAGVDGLLSATEPVVRALLDEARRKKYFSGVLGVQATSRWHTRTTFSHAETPVEVVPCPSTLAVWEALERRAEGSWLVVITPGDRDDLGDGIISHFVGNKLRAPDAWQAVRDRFSATRVDPALNTDPRHRAIAEGLLAAMPEDGWPPAPGGVLTKDHAFRSVIRQHLDMADHNVEVDLRTVLEWSMRADATDLLAQLRKIVPDPLTDALIVWIAGRCGLLARAVQTLLMSGRIGDLLPLGLIVGLLADDRPHLAHAAGVIQGRYGFGYLSNEALRSWRDEATDLVTHVLSREAVQRATRTASDRLAELDLSELAERSNILPAGLTCRIRTLAEALARALPASAPDDIDCAIVRNGLPAVERALTSVSEHHLAADSQDVTACTSALRLLRWLAQDVQCEDSLAALVRRHVDADAWVDAAINDVKASDSQVADVFATLINFVRLRRDRHDVAFAEALAATEEPAELCVEHLLPRHAIPMATTQPMLCLVIDALSASVATELVADLCGRGWVERSLPGRSERAGALAVLPSRTYPSRCSLLSGELAFGDQSAERRGFAQLLKREGLPTSGVLPLFHQADLDKVRQGLSLAPAVQTAIADTTAQPLVAAVLNVVDQTLHHTDPAGADWNINTIKHLRPLLDAARQAGRLVMITSDHGHVLERRNGEFRKVDTADGNRARAATSAPGTGEVLVQGPRVLNDRHSAVLAVNERLRYGPINAGYHGGAAPAEVVVPVVLLSSGEDAGLAPVSNVEPGWWDDTTSSLQDVSTETPQQGLFEVQRPSPRPENKEAARQAKRVVGSSVFGRQKAIAGRLTLADEQIQALLTALLSAPGNRISVQQASAILGIAPRRLNGALSMVKRVLDVEGYVVVSVENESSQVVLDASLLREQFGLSR